MSIFEIMGEQLRQVRRSRGLRQAELAQRLGRNRSRISELERWLLTNQKGRDRLTLFADMCAGLEVVPILVPRERASEIRALVAGEGPDKMRRRSRS